MKNRKFREIAPADVGRIALRAFDHVWPTAMFLPPGQKIARADIGKRVYLDRGGKTLTVETDAEYVARQARVSEGTRVAGKLTATERRAKRKFVQAVELLMLDLGAESVGHIADDVGEHGTDGDGGTVEDAVVVDCLRVIVDAMARSGR